MSYLKRGLKLARLAVTPIFARAVLTSRVAAATEHLEAIAFTKAKTLIDVGANKGQFSLAFRSLVPDGKIIAFEPLEATGTKFEQVFKKDPNVVLRRLALSDKTGEAEFHVTDRTDSSSLFRPGSKQQEAFGVREASTVKVLLSTLDNQIDFESIEHPVILKIDVQGAELDVLKGCTSLQFIDYVYVELSFVELYDDQPLFEDVVQELAKRGFEVRGIFNPVSTKRFGPTQVDVLFCPRGGGQSVG